MLLRSNQFHKAIEKYTASLKYDISNASTWSNRAITYDLLGMKAHAKQDRKHAHILSINHPTYLPNSDCDT